jgi:hypothetical protein
MKTFIAILFAACMVQVTSTVKADSPKTTLLRHTVAPSNISTDAVVTLSPFDTTLPFALVPVSTQHPVVEWEWETIYLPVPDVIGQTAKGHLSISKPPGNCPRL